MEEKIKKTEPKLMKGNEALAEAAIRAGMDAYFGYPITPQSEILEYFEAEIPKRKGLVLQAESEVAAINMIYGAAGAGARVMTTSSSPGISLMQEGLSYIAAAQLPCLVVNVVRGGPGLGTIQPSQGDYFQAVKGGGHGDYHRMPAMILSDGALGQMMEKVNLPEEGSLPHTIPDWATIGKPASRERNVITSLHMQSEKMEEINLGLQENYKKLHSEVRFEEFQTTDAEVLLVAFGLSARVCQKAVELGREKGIKVGLLRPITLYPFPSIKIKELAAKTDFLLVVEMNAGQMVEDVALAVNGIKPVHFKGRMGGMIPSPEDVLEEIESIIEKQIVGVF
jgi:2-oxoglutarate ferredoxin oxidoreductase subunit alpha